VAVSVTLAPIAGSILHSPVFSVQLIPMGFRGHRAAPGAGFGHGEQEGERGGDGPRAPHRHGAGRPLTLSQPVQPARPTPGLGGAVNVTIVPKPKVALHALPQSIAASGLWRQPCPPRPCGSP